MRVRLEPEYVAAVGRDLLELRQESTKRVLDYDEDVERRLTVLNGVRRLLSRSETFGLNNEPYDRRSLMLVADRILTNGEISARDGSELPEEVLDRILREDGSPTLLLHHYKGRRRRGFFVSESPSIANDFAPVLWGSHRFKLNFDDPLEALFDWVASHRHTSADCFVIDPYLLKFKPQVVRHGLTKVLWKLIDIDENSVFNLICLTTYDAKTWPSPDEVSNMLYGLKESIEGHLGGTANVTVAALDSSRLRHRASTDTPHDRFILTQYAELSASHGFDFTKPGRNGLISKYENRFDFVSVYEDEENYRKAAKEAGRWLIELKRQLSKGVAHQVGPADSERGELFSTSTSRRW